MGNASSSLCAASRVEFIPAVGESRMVNGSASVSTRTPNCSRRHEDVQTTHGYVEADADMKRKTLAALPPLTGRRRRDPRRRMS